MPITPQNKPICQTIVLASILFLFSYSSWHLSNLLLSPALTCHSAHSTSELTPKHESISNEPVLVFCEKTQSYQLVLCFISVQPVIF
ncbi:hypothetical protein A9G37_02900 [Gilliamella sp. GillExp13]|nr:hypothetical protein A9G37_02900 [Gilliamella apicola]